MFTEEEIVNSLWLNNNPSPRITKISAEMIKAGGKELHKVIYGLSESILEKEKLPGEWTKVRI